MPPSCADDFDGIRDLVEWLFTQRVENDPRLVQTGKMSREDADRRVRVMLSVRMLWDAVADREEIPQLSASWREMADDLTSVAAIQAARDPADREGILRHLTALVWHHQPQPGLNIPRIAFVHSINQARQTYD